MDDIEVRMWEDDSNALEYQMSQSDSQQTNDVLPSLPEMNIKINRKRSDETRCATNY